MLGPAASPLTHAGTEKGAHVTDLPHQVVTATSSLRRIEDTLFVSAGRLPQKPVIVENDRPVDYATFAAAATGLAAVLVQRGLAPGDRVSIFLEKSPQAAVAMYGVWAAGGVAVPVNEGLRSTQVKHIVEDSGSRFFISHPRKLATLEPDTLGAIPTLEIDLPELAASNAARPSDLTGGDTPATILYTSGSTGRPKGILISHANLLAGARIVIKYLGIREEERLLSVLPFSFDYGLNQLLTVVQQGATLYLQRSHLPADICRALERYEITGLAAVPTLWIQLMQRHSPFRNFQFPRLSYITNSGGVFPVDLVKQYREHLPHVRIFLMYGLSEAFRSTYLPPEETDRRPASMGKPIPETEILVVEEGGRVCGPDEVGELVHAGPTVALGYWNRPDATAAAYRPHPLRPGSSERVVYSGDLVRRDSEGFLYFVGRRDQQIKSHGFRVSPEEVEESLFQSGLVAEVVVRGIPDEIAGQAIVAHVVPKAPDTFTPEALLAYCADAMPRYMVPKRIEVHPSFPRTSSGKLDRKAVGAS
jgi:acyl-CoA ligase (AMP-forming) (exosortase A-associated)